MVILADPDDAEAVHLILEGAHGELCETAGDTGTSDPAEVTCRECISEIVARRLDVR